MNRSYLYKKNRGFYERGFVGAVRELPLLIRARKNSLAVSQYVTLLAGYCVSVLVCKSVRLLS